MVTQEKGQDIVPPAPVHDGRGKRRFDWKQKMVGSRSNSTTQGERDSDVEEKLEKKPAKWSMGILNDRETEEVCSLCVKIHRTTLYLRDRRLPCVR